MNAAVIHPRHKLAVLIRHFYTGQITNWKFEDRADPFLCNDSAAHEVFWREAWMSYGDFPEYRFTDRSKLTKEDRRTVARWILFLESGQPYEWPLREEKKDARLNLGVVLSSRAMIAWLWRCLVIIFSRSLLGTTIGYNQNCFNPTIISPSTSDNWPFRHEADFAEARRHPPFLAGKGPSS